MIEWVTIIFEFDLKKKYKWRQIFDGISFFIYIFKFKENLSFMYLKVSRQEVIWERKMKMMWNEIV